jgi:hypothetical protein
MADASALPTDDDQQPGPTSASLESPLAEGEAPDLASLDPSEPEAKPAEPSPEWTADVAQQAVPAAQLDEADGAAEPASEPAAAAPEPAPLPEPEVGPLTPPPVATVPTVPTVATTIDLPARGGSAGASPTAEGGEWALLLSKLQAWLGSGQLQAQLQAARTPFTLVAGLIAVLVVLQIYGALLAVIESFPLAPGLLELVGLIAFVRFALVKLVRSQERRALIEGLQQRWKAFQGKA